MGKFDAREKTKYFPAGILIAAVLVTTPALLPRLMNRAEEAPENKSVEPNLQSRMLP